MTTNAVLNDLLETAKMAADAAAAETLQYFRFGDLRTKSKDSNGYDPVTVADRAAEKAIRAVLGKFRPDDAILGEEFGETPGTSGFRWVLDPIDGTRGYVAGTPTWGTLISVEAEDGPILGLVDQPYIGERFIGCAGRAELTHNGTTRKISVRKSARLGDAVLFTTFPEVGTEGEGAAFRALASQTKLVRYGMDCYAYALLAAGQIDLVVEAGLQIYDIQAPAALIEAAGGIVTNWEGAPVWQGGRALAAATADLHEAALRILANS